MYKCPTCSKEFERKQDMKKHFQVKKRCAVKTSMLLAEATYKCDSE